MTPEYDLPPGIPQPKTDNAPKGTEAVEAPRKSFLARKIGAFWIEEDKNKKQYLSGTVRAPDGREERVYLFKAVNRTKETHPHWEMFLGELDYELRQKGTTNKDLAL